MSRNIIIILVVLALAVAGGVFLLKKSELQANPKPKEMAVNEENSSEEEEAVVEDASITQFNEIPEQPAEDIDNEVKRLDQMIDETSTDDFEEDSLSDL